MSELDDAKEKALSGLLEITNKITEDLFNLRECFLNPTEESLDKACDIEYELTGDMECTTTIAQVLNLASYMDCDCSGDREENNQNKNLHYEDCRYYKE